MNPAPPPTYQVRILPELQRIQHEHGYLEPAALRRFSKSSGIPLYRLNAVASFFPHFRRTPPPRVTLRVCRDMACHMNGSGQMLQELRSLAADGQVEVEGVSCLGRCDKPVAACVARHHAPGEHAAHGESERYLQARSAGELQRVVNDCLSGQATVPPPSSRR